MRKLHSRIFTISEPDNNNNNEPQPLFRNIQIYNSAFEMLKYIGIAKKTILLL